MATLAYFARWLFAGSTAGLLAAFLYAVFPGSVYYGRTFMPDAAMVFFLVAALYAVTRFLVEDEQLSVADLAVTTGLLTLANTISRGTRQRRWRSCRCWACSGNITGRTD